MGLFGAKQSADPLVIAQQQRAQEEQEVNAAFLKGITALRDFIAPSSLEYSGTHFQLGTLRPHLLCLRLPAPDLHWLVG